MPEPGEPLWSDDDRLWAVALMEFEAQTCSGCGQPRDESESPASEYAYAVEPVRCHACAAVARAAGKFRDKGGDSDGLSFRVSRDGV